MLYKIRLEILFDGEKCLASEMLLFKAQCVIIMIIRLLNFEINPRKTYGVRPFYA